MTSEEHADTNITSLKPTLDELGCVDTAMCNSDCEIFDEKTTADDSCSTSEVPVCLFSGHRALQLRKLSLVAL